MKIGIFVLIYIKILKVLSCIQLFFEDVVLKLIQKMEYVLRLEGYLEVRRDVEKSGMVFYIKKVYVKLWEGLRN